MAGLVNGWITGNTVIVTLFGPKEELLEKKGIRKEEIIMGQFLKNLMKGKKRHKENPQITRKELAKALDISSDGVKYHLNNLKKEGILKRLGGRKEGHWEVIK